MMYEDLLKKNGFRSETPTVWRAETSEGIVLYVKKEIEGELYSVMVSDTEIPADKAKQIEPLRSYLKEVAKRDRERLREELIQSEYAQFSEQVRQKFPPTLFDIVRRAIAPSATPMELSYFLSVAAKYDLDPLIGDIHLLTIIDKRGERRTAIRVSRTGLQKIAERHDDFEGVSSEVVREGDEFEMQYSEEGKPTVKHIIKGGKKIEGAWAICRRKERIPVAVYFRLDEGEKSSQVWRSYTPAMIRKVAESFVLRRMFSISIPAKEEVGSDEENLNVRITDRTYEELANEIEAEHGYEIEEVVEE